MNPKPHSCTFEIVGFELATSRVILDACPVCDAVPPTSDLARPSAAATNPYNSFLASLAGSLQQCRTRHNTRPATKRLKIHSEFVSHKSLSHTPPVYWCSTYQSTNLPIYQRLSHTPGATLALRAEVTGNRIGPHLQPQANHEGD